MKVQRINMWTESEDKFLAETILRYVREGKTQLQAFEDVGEQLDRSPGGVGFHWNAILRKDYEQELLDVRREWWAIKKARMYAHRGR